MRKCGTGCCSSQLSADTIIGEDCQGNVIYAGNAIATCSDLSSLGASDTYVTGASFNGTTNTVTLTRNNGLPEITFDLSLLANSDTHVTGASFDNTTGVLTISRNNSLPDITVSLSSLSGTDTNDYVNSATLSGNTLVLGRTGGLPDLSVDLSSVSGGADNYVDSAALSGNTLVLGRTGGLPNLTVDLSSLGGGGTDTNDYVNSATLSGNTLVLGRTGSLTDLSVDLSSLSGGGGSTGLTSVSTNQTIHGDGTSGAPLGVQLSNAGGNQLSIYTDGLYYGVTPQQPDFYFSPTGSPTGDGTMANPYRNPEDIYGQLQTGKAYTFHFQTGGVYEFLTSKKFTAYKLIIKPYGTDWDTALAGSGGLAEWLLAQTNATFTKPILEFKPDSTHTSIGTTYTDLQTIVAETKSAEIEFIGMDIRGLSHHIPGTTTPYPDNPLINAYLIGFNSLTFAGTDVQVSDYHFSAINDNVTYYHGKLSRSIIGTGAGFISVDSRKIFNIDVTASEPSTSGQALGNYQYTTNFSDTNEIKTFVVGITGMVSGNVASTHSLI